MGQLLVDEATTGGFGSPQFVDVNQHRTRTLHDFGLSV
jgi:hypothetical protein